MGSGASNALNPLLEERGEERRKKAAKIPLNIALIAIVKIQVRYRMKLARRRFEAMKVKLLEEQRLEEIARRAKIDERDEITPMVTSTANGLNFSGEWNTQNRFIRKVPQAKRTSNLKPSSARTGLSDAESELVLSKYTPIDSSHRVIYPLVGFVVKSKSNRTGKKILFNICHHETIATMVAPPVREITDVLAAALAREAASMQLAGNSSSARPFTANSTVGNLSPREPGSAGMDQLEDALTVLIGDILLPTQEFEECFKYDDEGGIAPVDPAVRQEIVRQAIKFWNLTHDDDVADSCTYPKIKRGYFGDLLPLCLDNKAKTVWHLASALQESVTNRTVPTAQTQDTHLSSFLFPPLEATKKERFRLPYATELRSWADLVTVGQRQMLVNNALPSYDPARVLALVEPTKALKSALTHPVSLTSTVLPQGIVETVMPAKAPKKLIPMFGAALVTDTIDAVAVVDAARLPPAAGTVPVEMKAPVVVPVAPNPIQQRRASRAVEQQQHQLRLQQAAAGGDSSSGVATAVAVDSATASAGAYAAGIVTATSVADSALLDPVPTECNTTIPVFLVLSQGVLYVYNRDPSRRAYFPYNAPRPAVKEKPRTGKSMKGMDPPNSPPEVSKTQAPQRKVENIPLVLYGRIMLTEHCVLTWTVEGKQGNTWQIHFRPQSPAKAKPEDTIAALYTQLHPMFQSTGVTINVRSLSEFRTWKAHLRTHIQLSAAVRQRIITKYTTALTTVNGCVLGGEFISQFGEMQYLHNALKIFARVENGLFLIYDERLPDDVVGRNFVKAVLLANRAVSVRNEMLPDNSSRNILTIADQSGAAVDYCEFTFPKPYAMDEFESQRFLDSLRQHAQLAHARQCAYFLPLLESLQDAAVVANKVDATSVQLTVSAVEGMDSDDEDQDEIEHALRKHSLLTILYLYHPHPLQEAQRKVDAALGPAPLTSTALLSAGKVGIADLGTSEMSPEAQLCAATVHTSEELEVLESLSSEQYKTSGENQGADVVMLGSKLYFFQNMRYLFSLDVTHCGDRKALQAARAWEKTEITALKLKTLRDRKKNSVYYIGSSSDEEEEQAKQSEGSFTVPLSRLNSSGSLIEPTPPVSASPRSGSRQLSRGGRSLKAPEPPAPAPQPEPVVERPPPPPRELVESVAPPNYAITSWTIQLVCYDQRTYTLKLKNAAEYHFWRELLFNAGRHVSETMQDALDAEKASALPPLQENAFPEQDDALRASGSAGDPGKEDSLQFPETTSLVTDMGSMELAEASLTSNTSKKGLFSSLTFPSIVNEKEVDLIATKKYARILKKNEKVLAAGPVIRHVSSGNAAGAQGGGATKQQRRVLVLTDAPRLLFFDTGAGTVQGALDIRGAAPVDLRALTSADFEVVVGGTAHKVTSAEVSDKSAAFWVSKIKLAMNVGLAA